MITGYVGKPGSGKSLALINGVVNDLLRGRQVYTNFTIKIPALLQLAWKRGLWYEWGEPCRLDFVKRFTDNWSVMRSYDDMVSVREGRLYFDEAHLWLWSRAYREIPRAVISWWSQSRKHGVDVFYATQRMGSVDVHVRELTTWAWNCRRVGNSLWFVYQADDLEQQERRRVWQRRLVKLDPEVAACYDTYQILPPPWDAHPPDDELPQARTRLPRRAAQLRRSLRVQ